MTAALLPEPTAAVDHDRTSQHGRSVVDTDASTAPGRRGRVVELPIQRAVGSEPEAGRGGASDTDTSAAAAARVDGQARRWHGTAEASRAERFAEVYQTCWPPTVRFIERQLRPGDRHCAQDLAQTTLLQAWRYLDRIGTAGEEAARRYVAGIARHVVADHYRRQAGRQRAAESAAAPEAALWGSSRAAVDDDTTAVDIRLDLRTALAQLDAETAEVLRLRFAEDLEVRDVARRIGRSRATTVRRQAEGLAELRAQLTAHADAGPPAEQRRAHRPPAATPGVDRAEVDPALAAATLREYGAARMPRALNGLAEATTGPYLAGWRQRVIPALGDRPVGSISGAEVNQAVRSWTADDGTPSTVKNTRAVLRRVLDQAVRDGILPRNPADARPATEADTDGNTDDRREADPLVRASHAAARVHRARLVLERHDAQRARAQQLARWHTDDHPAEHAAADGAGRGVAEQVAR